MKKATDELPNEEIHKAKVWKYPKHGSFGPCGAGAHHPPGTWMCSPTWSLPKPHAVRVSIKASVHEHWLSSTPLPAPPLSQENWGLRLKIPNFQSWLGLSGGQPPAGTIQEPTLTGTKDTHITRKYQGIWEPVSGTKDQILEYIMLLVFLSLRKLQGLWELCAGNGGQRLDVRTEDFPSSSIYKGFRSHVSGTRAETKA